LFAQSRLLNDTAASEAALQRIAAADGLRRFDVLHFATHGLISPRQPWASALVLADPGPGEAGDGYLTVAEMGRLGLAARLVVLSACDTATGNALEGEGVLGFPYVLLASGASATMLTLWPIEDAATARLMPEVLGEVRRGQAPSRALAAAKRRQLERGGARDARAWAGLLVYGL
jgi:CHAT domain-containing protein